MILVKDGKAHFIQVGLLQWGFLVGERTGTQLQLRQGQVGI